MAILFILAFVFLIGAIALHRSADRDERRFENRPSVITNPATDLFTNQKYAIMKIMIFLQGTSPLSAYDDEANRIVQETKDSMGLSAGEVTRLLMHSMDEDSETEVACIMDSLHEIRDKNFLGQFCRKCMRIAEISGNVEMMEVVRAMSKELGVLNI